MKHAIYGLCEPSTKFVRYVGYNFDNGGPRNLQRRLWEHIADSKQRADTHKQKWIRKLLRGGKLPEIVVLEVVTEETWREREVFWIAKLRIPNRLTNSTDGGEGLINPTQDIRDRISVKVSKLLQGNQRAIGMRHTEETKQSFRAAMSEMWQPGGVMATRKVAVISKEGREALKLHAGSQWINRQGTTKRLIAGQVLPSGWSYGRAKLSIEQRAKIAESLRGTRWIYKGSKVTRLALGKELPIGWKFGNPKMCGINELGQFVRKSA